MKKIVWTILFSLCLTAAAAAQSKSVYTILAEKSCKTISSTDQEGGSYRGFCPGAAGYRLELLEGDLRQTVNIIAPNKVKSELDLWSVVSGGFSSVGDRAEWRLRGGRPFALILRYNASENPENSTKYTSYLVVARISGKTSCVTDVVKPGADQNAQARALADKAAGKRCYSGK